MPNPIDRGHRVPPAKPPVAPPGAKPASPKEWKENFTKLISYKSNNDVANQKVMLRFFHDHLAFPFDPAKADEETKTLYAEIIKIFSGAIQTGDDLKNYYVACLPALFPEPNFELRRILLASRLEILDKNMKSLKNSDETIAIFYQRERLNHRTKNLDFLKGLSPNAELASLAGDIAAKDLKIRQLQVTIQELEERVQGLRAEHKDADQAYTGAESARAAEKAARDRAEKSVVLLRDEITRLEGELSSVLPRATEDVQNLNKQITALEKRAQEADVAAVYAKGEAALRNTALNKAANFAHEYALEYDLITLLTITPQNRQDARNVLFAIFKELYREGFVPTKEALKQYNLKVGEIGKAFGGDSPEIAGLTGYITRAIYQKIITLKP